MISNLQWRSFTEGCEIVGIEADSDVAEDDKSVLKFSFLVLIIYVFTISEGNIGKNKIRCVQGVNSMYQKEKNKINFSVQGNQNTNNQMTEGKLG